MCSKFWMKIDILEKYARKYDYKRMAMLQTTHSKIISWLMLRFLFFFSSICLFGIFQFNACVNEMAFEMTPSITVDAIENNTDNIRMD